MTLKRHTYYTVLVILFFFNKFYADDKSTYLKIINNQYSSDSAKYEAYFELGWNFIGSSSDTSYQYASKAFLYAKKLNSRFYQAKVFNLIGAYFQTKGIYAKAIDYYQQSLKLGERIDNPEIILAALGNIGAIYLNTDKHKQALDYLQKSQALTEPNSPNLPNIYNNLSIAYIGLKDYKNALTYAEKALQLFEKNKNESAMAMAYASIATAQFKIGNNKEALASFKKSLSVSKKFEDVYQEVDAYIGIAEIYKSEHKKDSAIWYGKKTLELGENIKHYSVVIQANTLLIDIYKEKKDYEKAVYYQEKLQQSKDAYNKESETQMIEQKMLEYNFNKRIHEDSLKNAFAIRDRDTKIKENQAQIKQDKLFKTGLIIIVFLALGFIIFAYNRVKVISSKNKLIELKNKQSEEQKLVILQKNKEVKDSLNYAKRIQEGLLASDKLLTKNLKKYFVFFKPKDIVSGDFYWSTEYQNSFYLAICDSTGHGVPGAFMSLLNIALLSEAIKEKQIKEPHLIFNEVRERLIEIISADGHKDGFDGILIRIEKPINGAIKLQYAAANNEPILVRDNQVLKLAADRMPVSKSDFNKSFTLQTIDIIEGDTLYLYTDGFADQFGGEQQKKFKRKHLNDLLCKNSNRDTDHQWQILNNTFNDWKQNEEQIDDVCVVGIQF